VQQHNKNTTICRTPSHKLLPIYAYRHILTYNIYICLVNNILEGEPKQHLIAFSDRPI